MRGSPICMIFLIISLGVFPSRLIPLVVSIAFNQEPQMTQSNFSMNRQVTPSQLWNRTYSQSREDIAFSGIETQDGGLAILGQSDPPGSGGADFWLIKTDPNGNLLWSRTYGGDDFGCGFSIIQTIDGGLALAGYTYSYGNGGVDGWLIKTDAKGKVQWQQTYGGESYDIAQTVIQTADEGYLLGGYTESGAWLVKTDKHGEKQWNRSRGYSGFHGSEITAVLQTHDGGYLFVGEIRVGDSATPHELWIGKTNATGELLWNHTYGRQGYDHASSLIETTDDTYVIVGSTTNYDSGYSDFWFLKMNSSGILDWNITYGGRDIDIGYSVVQTTDGGYALLGITKAFGAGLDDFWLIKTDTNGTHQWNQTYGTSGGERGVCLIPTSDGGLVMIGDTDPPITKLPHYYNTSYLVIKVGGKLAPTTQPETSHTCPLPRWGVPLLMLILIILLPLLVWQRKSRKS